MGKVVSIQENLTYWMRVRQLEIGRAEVLRHVVQGHDIKLILSILCQRSEEYNPQMKTSVLYLDPENQTLHPVASVSLPQTYCDALEGVRIGIGVGSCGTSAFSKKRVIVEDINTHPYWAQYRQLALDAGLQACWSEPIIGAQGRVFGTFAIYYARPHSPTPEDLQFIETSANLAAVVFENNEYRQQLIEANRQLSQTVDARNQELKRVNQELSKLLENQKEQAKIQLETEKELTIKSLLVGFAHELNTPLGVALTAISSSMSDIKKISDGIKQKSLTQAQALQLLEGCSYKAELTQSNIFKASELIQHFKLIDTSESHYSEQVFDMSSLLTDLKEFVETKNNFKHLTIESCAGIQSHSKYALWQVLLGLIDNSLMHGFDGTNNGHISIRVFKSCDNINITYYDDGKGIADSERAKVFEPFYSSERKKGSVGLGLNIVRNIITSIYQGSIELVNSPVGVRFQITMPDQS